MSDPGQPPPEGWAPIRPVDANAPESQPWEAGAIPPAVPAAPEPQGGGPRYKAPKPASVGWRAPSMALVGGLGLLGVLITVAIMALLAGRVMSSVQDSPGLNSVTSASPPTSTDQTADNPPATDPASGDPGATDSTALSTPPPAEGPGGAIGSAEVTACSVNRSTLETAVQASYAMNGVPPADQQQLVSEGLLAAPVPDFVLSVDAGQVQVVGQGACAGR